MSTETNKHALVSLKTLAFIENKMRILHILPSYLPAVRYGGPTFAVHGLCSALAAQGNQIEVFTTSINGAEDSDVPLCTPVPLDGVLVTYFPSRIFRRLFWSPPLARALNKNIASFSIVHLHSVFLWPTWAAARTARKFKIPYLISPRGMLVKELIERRSKFVKSAWLSAIERANLENASAIHVTSKIEADELRKFRWRLPRIETIPNGVADIVNVDLAGLSADVRDIALQKPFVLFLGRLSWKKGLDRLLQAFALTDLPSLVIVGPDDENIVPHLVQLAKDLDISERVRFLSRTVLGSDKEHLYASAELFVLPSYSENFGNTVLEAMQRGLPVVTTPEVGAAKIVEEAAAGLVASGEPLPLSTAILQLSKNPVQAKAMGDAGRQHVVKHFGWPRVATEMEALYESILRNDAGHSR